MISGTTVTVSIISISMTKRGKIMVKKIALKYKTKAIYFCTSITLYNCIQ